MLTLAKTSIDYAMYIFRIHIHRRPSEVASGGNVAIDGAAVQTLACSPVSSNNSLHVTFDRAVEILTMLPRMFIEPDGSFVWTGKQDDELWQVEGVLYDAGPRLAYVEMSGRCPPDEFDQFIAALGWPALPLMFQWAAAGVFIGEEEFRRLAVR